jgi:hypothetical protein
MAEIRTCTVDDIPAVARMFQRTFRDSHDAAPESLQSCLREVFFAHPWRDPELPSRVYVADDGAVGGFIGVLPLRMSFRGRAVRAAVPSSLMVDEPGRDPLAGARLLRSFFAGPQELSLSEPLNAVSQAMWKRLGGQSVTSESMEWLRVFRPAGLGLALLGERLPARLLRPFGQAADRLADRLAGGLLAVAHTPRSRNRDADMSDEELFRHMPAFAESYALHPEWDAGTLKWQLAHAARNSGRGTLYRRMVYGKNDAPLGCYLYHSQRGQVAWVLQILSRPDAVDAVLDSLLAHAHAQGSVAVKGRTQARLMDALLERQCFFFRRHSAAAHSRNPELLAAVRSGEAMTSGLAGESWTRLIGDTFH